MRVTGLQLVLKLIGMSCDDYFAVQYWFLLSLFYSGSRVTAEIAPELREKRALKQSKMSIRIIINTIVV